MTSWPFMSMARAHGSPSFPRPRKPIFIGVPFKLMPDVNAAASALCNGQPLILSILIGPVSTHDTKRILETLEALRVQSGSPPHEVIIAHRRLDAASEIIRSQYPAVRVLPCAVGTSLPELRTLAFESSRGESVVITEDHCVPPKNWLASILEAFNEAPIAAVGGAIENGLCDTVLDWA